ncbi:unnamed protein product, partial [Phaeothamnion confervicola]
LVEGVRQLSERYDGFILDQFGVLLNGREALPGAIECLDELHRRGKKLVILSNTSKREAFAMQRLPHYGFKPSLFSGGITSGEEGLQHILANGLANKRAVILTWHGPDSDGLLEAAGLIPSAVEDADIILCHGPDVMVTDAGPTDTELRTTGSLDAYAGVALRRGLPMLNLNPDIRVNNPDGGLLYMPGLIAEAYEQM